MKYRNSKLTVRKLVLQYPCMTIFNGRATNLLLDRFESTDAYMFVTWQVFRVLVAAQLLPYGQAKRPFFTAKFLWQRV